MTARVCALGACLAMLACGPDDGETDKPAENVIETTLRVLPPDEDYRGKNLEGWAVEYMRWYYSWTSAQCLNAENDRDGSRCAFNQPADSPVFFFASCDYSRTPDVVVRRSLCKVPEGKAIMVPLSFIGDDNAGVFEEDELRTPEEIVENVATIHDSMRDLTLVSDQRTVEDLSGYSVGPLSFDFSVGATPNWHSCSGFDDVENTTVSGSYVAGYFALVAPPTVGKHRLEYSGVYTYYERDYFRRVDALFEVTKP